MKAPIRLAVAILAILVAPALVSVPAVAEEGVWKDTAEFSLVTTSGNSEGTTFGFKNTLSKKWDRSSFEVKAGGVRVETTELNVPINATETRDIDSVTAESYFLNGRYDRKITDSFFWYTGLGWDRNRFAGIQNRYIGVAGVGNLWFDEDDRRFRTDYALTYTDQEDVVLNPLVDDTFAGLRLSWDYMNKFGANTTYTNTLVIDGNLDETDDYRADMVNALAVAMSQRMALKLSLQWLYDNEPSFDIIPFSDFGGVDQPFQLDELDQIFTASLVVNF